MKNLTVPETKQKIKEELPPSQLRDDIKFLLDNSVYQNAEIKGKVFFINEEDLDKLPEQILGLVEDKK